MPEGEPQSPSQEQLRQDQLSVIEAVVRDMMGVADDDTEYATLRTSLTTAISDLDNLEE